MISTRKLAELAGVSQSTVSRSLNDRPEISTDTKERIRALARAHGYVVRQKRKKTICSTARRAVGVLMMSQPFFKDLFNNQLASVLYSVIEQENYYAMPLLDYEGENGVEKLRDLLSLGLIEGFIIVSREYDAIMDQYLREIGIPHVFLVYYRRRLAHQVHIVGTDNFTGGYVATKHLLDLGHRCIATLTSPYEEFQDRTNGYKAALQEYGVPFRSELVLSANCHFEQSYATMRGRMDLFSISSALFAQYDVGAMAAMCALHDVGYRVPDDISVVGLDGLDFGTMYRPEITSVRQPFEDLARISMQRLLELINMPEKYHSQGKVFLRPELIIRGSTAPYQKR